MSRRARKTAGDARDLRRSVGESLRQMNVHGARVMDLLADWRPEAAASSQVDRHAEPRGASGSSNQRTRGVTKKLGKQVAALGGRLTALERQGVPRAGKQGAKEVGATEPEVLARQHIAVLKSHGKRLDKLEHSASHMQSSGRSGEHVISSPKAGGPSRVDAEQTQAAMAQLEQRLTLVEQRLEKIDGFNGLLTNLEGRLQNRS